jgi:hypothetical protein
MDRRAFLKAAISGIFVCGSVPDALAGVFLNHPPVPNPSSNGGESAYEYLKKMKNFNRPHPNDMYLDAKEFEILRNSLQRLRRIHRTVGYGNFHLVGLDDALKIARNYSRVGRFSKTELKFLEWLFYEDASHYGFYGKKPLSDITDQIPKREVVKIQGTGHYLYRGEPYEFYKKIRKDVGSQSVLTSGVRSIIKQTLLFLNKAKKTRGNLSMASRSLAPPGFSYHGIGDFDIGQAGYGIANFTERFATTKVYKRLHKLGYIKFRYNRNNVLGVRFEPWHIKVKSISTNS